MGRVGEAAETAEEPGSPGGSATRGAGSAGPQSGNGRVTTFEHSYGFPFDSFQRRGVRGPR